MNRFEIQPNSNEERVEKNKTSPFHEKLSETLQHYTETESIARQQNEFDEKIENPGNTAHYECISNEPSLYEVFPYIKNTQGDVLGVGVDQLFDMAVNNQKLDRLYCIDFTEANTLTTRMLMEVARKHTKMFGEPPIPHDYIQYFAEENTELTLRMLSDRFSAEQLSILKQVLSTRVEKRQNSSPNESKSDLMLHAYLQSKYQQREYKSWMSDQEGIAHLLRKYEAGKIIPVNADLTGESAVRKISKQLRAENRSLAVVYLSNVEFGLEKTATPKVTVKFRENINQLPVNEYTRFVTTRSGGYSRELPEFIQNDPNLNAHMVAWRYFVRDKQDMKQEKKGFTYKKEEWQLKYDTVHDIDERTRIIHDLKVAPEKVGIIMPELGIYIAARIGKPEHN